LLYIINIFAYFILVQLFHFEDEAALIECLNRSRYEKIETKFDREAIIIQVRERLSFKQILKSFATIPTSINIIDIKWFVTNVRKKPISLYFLRKLCSIMPMVKLLLHIAIN
jgi:hypothetical protein